MHSVNEEIIKRYAFMMSLKFPILWHVMGAFIIQLNPENLECGFTDKRLLFMHLLVHMIQLLKLLK